MKWLVAIFALLLSTPGIHAQGSVLFANRVEAAGLEAPVTILGTLSGPGSSYVAQLLLVAPNGSLTPLLPRSTFQDALRNEPDLNRYWSPQVIEIPGYLPGASATFIVRAWEPHLGTFEEAKYTHFGMVGESLPFTVTLGGGNLDPAPLLTLQAFNIVPLPEPSTFVLGALGSAFLFLCRRR